MKRSLDIHALQWLSENYVKKYGLRNFNWRIIINGIILEHNKLNYYAKQDNKNKDDTMDPEQVNLIWFTYIKTVGIDDLSEVPNTNDPNHPHVKAILYMYSLDSFLFDRLN